MKFNEYNENNGSNDLSWHPYDEKSMGGDQGKTEESVEEEAPNTSGDNAQVKGIKPPKKKRGFKNPFAGVPKSMVTLMVICLVVSGLFGFGGGYVANQLLGGGKTVMYQSVDKTSSAGSTENESSTQKVADSASNSVVEIVTEAVTKSQFMQDMVTEGAGSGVIVTTDGYIVTNNHVIEGASKITVTTKDGTSYEGTLVGTDSESDVALVKINATNLQPAVMGDSDALAVGQDAIAIGNPLGELGGTVTEGIISALDREITLDGETMNLLQTSAAINPGNSGGGLFNSDGELIGIVVAKSSGEDVEGLGFAIPINDVKSVVESLQTDGYVKGRASLGVTLVDISSAEAAMQYRVNATGVYISEVSAGGAAASAGLKSGDRIVSVDGKEVSSASDVKQIIRSHSVGDKVSIVVARDNANETLTATLAESVATSE